MKWLLILFAISGISSNHVVLINHTGLKIVRIEIGNRKFEEVNDKVEKILISVTPEKHNMKLVFKGGAHIDWPNFDFKGVHQIIFQSVEHKISASFE